MKYDKLNRKKIFSISKQINSFYKKAKVSDDLFLRLVYYYFLSSKQILQIFNYLKVKASDYDEYELNLKRIKELFDSPSDLKDQIKEHLFESNGYYINLLNLHPFIIQNIKNDSVESFDLVTFISQIIANVDEHFAFEKIKLNYNELFLNSNHIKEQLCIFLDSVNFDLMDVANKYTRALENIVEDVYDDNSVNQIYSEIFDYQILNMVSKLDFINVTYVPSYIFNIYKQFQKFVNLDVVTAKINSKFNYSSMIDLISYNYLGKFEYNPKIVNRNEKAFISLSSSLDYKNYSHFSKISESSNGNYDLILANALESYQVTLSETEKNIFKRLTKDEISTPDKIDVEYKIILESIIGLNKSGFSLILIENEFLSKKSASKYRKWLTLNNYLYGIVNLPKGILENGPSSTSILVLQNKDANKEDKNVIMINAELDYKKIGNTRFMDEVHTINLAKNLQTKKEYENYSVNITPEQIKKEKFSFDIFKYGNFTKNKKASLDVKKMIKEVNHEKEIVKSIEDATKSKYI